MCDKLGYVCRLLSRNDPSKTSSILFSTFTYKFRYCTLSREQFLAVKQFVSQPSFTRCFHGHQANSQLKLFHTHAFLATNKNSENHEGFFKRFFKWPKYNETEMRRFGFQLYGDVASKTDVLHFFRGLSINLCYCYCVCMMSF